MSVSPHGGNRMPLDGFSWIFIRGGGGVVVVVVLKFAKKNKYIVKIGEE
jgi:hypothetical protein